MSDNNPVVELKLPVIPDIEAGRRTLKIVVHLDAPIP